MNSLSWLIYFAEVSGDLKGLFSGFAIITGVGVIVGTLFSWIELDQFSPRYVAFGLLGAFMLAVASVLMPSSKTVYMIAASEAGEVIVSSPEARELVGSIKKTILDRLNEGVEK